MAVLTNKARPIPALPETTGSRAGDFLIIQDVTSDVTKKITFSNLVNSIFSAPPSTVEFTGSFYVSSSHTLTSYGLTKLGVGPSGLPSINTYYDGALGNQVYIRTNIFDAVSNEGSITVTNTLFLEGSSVLINGNTEFNSPITASYGRITNLVATVTGNFFGGLYGDVYSATGNKVLENGAGPAKDAQFTGTSSYASRAKSASYAHVATNAFTCSTNVVFADTATSASYALSASQTQVAKTASYLEYSINNGSASYAVFAGSALNVINTPTTAVSASYALKSAATDEVDGVGLGNGSGSFNIAFFSQSVVASNVGMKRITNGTGLGNYQLLEISSSRYLNGLRVASRGYNGQNQSLISFYNLNNAKNLINYPNISGYTIGSINSGSLTFIAPLGSAEFSSSTRTAVGSATETYGLVSRRSGYYFWPYLASNTPSREGSIGIGFQPPTSADTNPTLLGKFSIRCFSSSKAHVGKVTGQALTGTVKLPEYAIYVDYGSSSYAPIFSVGASGSNAGDTYIAGDLTVDGNINGTFGYGPQTPNAFAVRYPIGAITYQDYIFYNQVNFTNNGYLFRLNQNTNAVTKILDGGTLGRSFQGGHMALHNFNNQGVTEDCIVFTDTNNYINVIGGLTTGSPTHQQYSSGTNFFRYRCVFVDASDNLHPTFYLLPDSYQAGSVNNANNLTMYKVYWNGSAYTYAAVGSALNLLNNNNIINYSTLQGINGLTNYNTITNIYNPIKCRLYCINNNSGMCDVYNLNLYSSNDIGAWWATAETGRSAQLTYEKTITIPQQGSNYWTDSNWETYSLEYDTTTGQELFWSWNRVNNSSLTGIVGKSPYYGS